MMENGKIIGLKGEPLVDTSSGHKRAHDPERHNNMRMMLNNVFVEMTRGWAADMFADPTGATAPNAQAIRQHWGEKWQAQAVAVLNSNEPIDVNPLRLFEWIDAELAAKERKAQLALPLHQLADLEPHGFKLLGLVYGDPVWVSTECAVHLRAGGNVQVFVRDQDFNRTEWASKKFVEYLFEWSADLSAPDYTLGELEQLLNAMRRERNAQPTEEDMNAARTALNTRKP